MKLLKGEIKCYMWRMAKTEKVISHIKSNEKHAAAVFRKFTPTEHDKKYGLNEETYFITIVDTHGKAYSQELTPNSQNRISFEVTKDEGIKLFEEIQKSGVFNYTLD